MKENSDTCTYIYYYLLHIITSLTLKVLELFIHMLLNAPLCYNNSLGQLRLQYGRPLKKKYDVNKSDFNNVTA